MNPNKLTFRIFAIFFLVLCLIPPVMMVIPEYSIISLKFLGALVVGGTIFIVGWCMMIHAIRAMAYDASIDRETFMSRLINEGKEGFTITSCNAVACARYPLGLTRFLEGKHNLDYTHSIFCVASDGSKHSAYIRIYKTTFGEEFNCPIGEWMLKVLPKNPA